MPKPYEKYLKYTLIDENTLQQRIQQLGATLTADYAETDDILLVCILKGGVMFLCDLMRHFHVPHEIDFLAVSSYGKGVRSSSGEVRIDMDLTAQVTGRHVLIVEDIIDSGHTLRFVINVLQARQAASVRLCTLLNKPDRRQTDIHIDYTGFVIRDEFVFGYGLDLDEKFRNLPFVGVVDLDKLTNESEPNQND
jgi:hypoxanthine phosphoribosyltransferase